ncbi:TPA: DNA-binding response regulator, partial [Klebsiella quasipneumoniae subsp. similipneumoniae]|nr:DNA-binding response regulator [Klebsiella quasipneumoniae subsp. similipneumoniae]
NDLTTIEYNQLFYLNVKIRFIVNRRKHIFSEVKNINALNIKNNEEYMINIHHKIISGKMRGDSKKISLTQKEMLVLMLYLNGFSIMQICNKTTISKSTVHIHFNHILHKTGIKSTRHLLLLKNILNYHLSFYL